MSVTPFGDCRSVGRPRRLATDAANIGASMTEGKVAGQGSTVLAEIVLTVAEEEHGRDCAVVIEIERDPERRGLPVPRLGRVFRQAKPLNQLPNRCRGQ